MPSPSEQAAQLLRRGLNHYAAGDPSAAIACWEKAAELNPDNQAVRDYLLSAYAEVARERAIADDEPATPRTAASALAAGSDGSDESAEGPKTQSQTNATEEDERVTRALDDYRAGRLEEAWSLLSEVAETDPDRLDVQAYLTLVRSERAQGWAAEIGDQGRSLRLKVSIDEVMAMDMTPEEGFLLSQIDGVLSIEQVISLASTDRVRTLEILARFVREGLVG